jgi:arginine decarboxylase
MMKDTLERWTIDDSADLYGIHNWGAGYFGISDKGHVVVTPMRDNRTVSVSLADLISEIKDRGLDMPVLLRIENILDSQIQKIHESFQAAFEMFSYKGQYRGVYPIKVNQQKQVVNEVTRFGSRYHYGLEAGSKAELIAALSFMKSPEACLICNGYKDEEFVDLGLYARKMGIQCFFVIEMLSELDLIIERSQMLNVRPLIGVRVKLSARAGGHWAEYKPAHRTGGHPEKEEHARLPQAGALPPGVPDTQYPGYPLGGAGGMSGLCGACG